MNLCLCRFAIRQLHAGNPLLFAPVAEAVLAPQQCEIANAAALGDSLNLSDIANDFELHNPVSYLCELDAKRSRKRARK
ncbi:MAG: hypothetical protein ACYCWC_11725 [Rhodocyclaceae bacterium]